MGREKGERIPEFKTLEEEKEYWEARGPLADGHNGTLNKPKPKQKRSSFLAVRLTGEELTRLRDMAARQGLGPSTYARMVLTSAIEGRIYTDIASLTEIVNEIQDLVSQLRIKQEEGTLVKRNT
jgi:hypothetical protein